MAAPCPFCRSSAIEPLELEPGERYAMRCQRCGMIGPPAETEDEAREAWDRRVDDEDFVTLPRKTLGVPWPPKG